MTQGAGKAGVFFASAMALAVLVFTPMIASAQLYVPVKDFELIDLFSQYRTDFNNFSNRMHQDLVTNPDSLRNIITGANLTEATVGQCSVGDNLAEDTKPEPSAGTGKEAAFPYELGSWASSSDQAGVPKGIPDGATESGPYVQINNSHSLRCLLEELIDGQKLGLSVQIHALLKTYIADAQTVQLNNQLMHQITAANSNWSKAANTIVNNGVISSTAIFNTNASQNIINESERQLEHAIDQCAADLASNNPVGSFEMSVEWRMDICANMAKNNRTEDPFNYTTEITRTSLQDYLDPGTYQGFQADYSTLDNKQGSWVTWRAMLDNPCGNTPLGAATCADQIAQDRIARQQAALDLEYKSSNFGNQKECSQTSSDPRCLGLLQTAVTPSGSTNALATGAMLEGNRQVQEAKTLDATGGDAAEQQSTKILQDGAFGYDPTDLQLSPTVVNQLVKEFYDTINIGYFGTTQDKRQWAEGTMLMIYDEMKFNPKSTETIVTNGEAPQPTGYGGDWPMP